MPTHVATGQLTLLDSMETPIGSLSNDSITLPANSSGVVSSYAGATTTLSINLGGIDDSANWTYSVVKSNVTCTEATTSRTQTVTNLSADVGYVDITATRFGFDSITKRFTLTKAKDGVAGIRGSQHFHLSGYTSWSNTAANTAAAVDGGPILNDLVTEYGTGFSQTKIWTGSVWSTVALTLDGSLLVSGSVVASALSVQSLSAISANLGSITAGQINFGSFTGYAWPAAGLSGVHISPSGILMGNPTAGGKYFQLAVVGEGAALYTNIPAYLEDLQVTTLKVADGAISNNTQVQNTATVSTSLTTWVDGVSAYADPQGGHISAIFTAIVSGTGSPGAVQWQTSAPAIEIRIISPSGTELNISKQEVTTYYYLNPNYLYFPSESVFSLVAKASTAGTYKVQYRMAAGWGVSLRQQTLILLGLKK